jgi:AcrR family transcriptional regulator
MNEADPRVKRTRKLIQDAFVELMGEKSFPSISVQDIAERATVNRATFYAHFVDKYALLEQVAGEWFREAVTKRVSATAPVTLTNLHTLVATVLGAFAEFRSHCKPPDRSLDPLIESRVQREIEVFLDEWLRRAPRADAPPTVSREAAVTVLSWAVFGAAVEWSRGTRPLSVDEMAHQVVLLLEPGIKALVDASRANHAPEEAGGGPRAASIEPATVGRR